MASDTEDDMPGINRCSSSESSGESEEEMTGLKHVDDSSSDSDSESESSASDDDESDDEKSDDEIKQNDVVVQERDESSDADESDDHDESSESQWQVLPSIEDDAEAADLPPVRARRVPRRSTTQEPNYVDENVDQYFNDGRPGYCHFGRTRKGGDTRPNGNVPTLPPALVSKVTIHNFFCAAGNNCLC